MSTALETAIQQAVVTLQQRYAKRAASSQGQHRLFGGPADTGRGSTKTLWDEKKHPRDEKGEFAEKGAVAPIKPKADHEMTLEEFTAAKGYTGDQRYFHAAKEHQKALWKAFEDHKKIPDEAVRGYPDLKREVDARRSRAETAAQASKEYRESEPGQIDAWHDWHSSDAMKKIHADLLKSSPEYQHLEKQAIDAHLKSTYDGDDINPDVLPFVARQELMAEREAKNKGIERPKNLAQAALAMRKAAANVPEFKPTTSPGQQRAQEKQKAIAENENKPKPIPTVPGQQQGLFSEEASGQKKLFDFVAPAKAKTEKPKEEKPLVEPVKQMESLPGQTSLLDGPKNVVEQAAGLLREGKKEEASKAIEDHAKANKLREFEAQHLVVKAKELAGIKEKTRAERKAGSLLLDKDSHDELLKQAAPYRTPGEGYNRSIHAAAAMLEGLKEKGVGKAGLDAQADVLKQRLEVHGQPPKVESEKPAFNGENFIKIAANSVKELRKQDVYRVLDSNDPKHMDKIADYVRKNRPELSGDVDEALRDIHEERGTTTKAGKQTPAAKSEPSTGQKFAHEMAGHILPLLAKHGFTVDMQRFREKYRDMPDEDKKAAVKELHSRGLVDATLARKRTPPTAQEIEDATHRHAKKMILERATPFKSKKIEEHPEWQLAINGKSGATKYQKRIDSAIHLAYQKLRETGIAQ